MKPWEIANGANRSAAQATKPLQCRCMSTCVCDSVYVQPLKQCLSYDKLRRAGFLPSGGNFPYEVLACGHVPLDSGDAHGPGIAYSGMFNCNPDSDDEPGRAPVALATNIAYNTHINLRAHTSTHVCSNAYAHKSALTTTCVHVCVYR